MPIGKFKTIPELLAHLRRAHNARVEKQTNIDGELTVRINAGILRSRSLPVRVSVDGFYYVETPESMEPEHLPTVLWDENQNSHAVALQQGSSDSGPGKNPQPESSDCESTALDGQAGEMKHNSSAVKEQPGFEKIVGHNRVQWRAHSSEYLPGCYFYCNLIGRRMELGHFFFTDVRSRNLPAPLVLSTAEFLLGSQDAWVQEHMGAECLADIRRTAREMRGARK